jgi:hypothetical protein
MEEENSAGSDFYIDFFSDFEHTALAYFFAWVGHKNN